MLCSVHSTQFHVFIKGLSNKYNNTTINHVYFKTKASHIIVLERYI